MKKYIPKDKLSKKARRLIDSRRRATWLISPVTRTVESKKVYDRHRKSRELQDDWIAGFLFLMNVQSFS